MRATAWHQDSENAFCLSTQWLDGDYQMSTRGPRNCSEALDYRERHEQCKSDSRHDIRECFQLSMLTAISLAENMVCYRSVCSVYITQLCVCLLQPVDWVLVLCMWLLSEIHALLVVCSTMYQCACIDCICLTQAWPTMSRIPLVVASNLTWEGSSLTLPYAVAAAICHFSTSFSTSGLLQALLEMIVGMTSDHSQKDAFKGMHRHLLHNTPASFSDAVVKPAAELIVVTWHCPNPKFR